MSVRTFSRQRDGNVQLSANFRVIEFASRDGSDKILIDTRLVDVLQKIRSWIGKPVNVSSGFRSQAHNVAVGGALRSFHLQGQAADITVSGVSPVDIARWAEAALTEADIPGGIIVYVGRNQFTHIDVRPAPRWRAVDYNGRVTSNSGWRPMPIPNAPDPTPTPPPRPGDNVQAVINFFAEKGLSNAAIAAIVGNLQQESGESINPAAIERPSGIGHGIVQWSHSRRDALFAAAKKQGVEWQDLDFQLDFMWREMQARDLSDRMRGYATTWNDNGAFLRTLNSKGAVALPNGFDDFISMTSVEAATVLFEAAFFRAGTPRMERRIKFAQNVYSIIEKVVVPQEPTEQLQSVNFNVRVTGTPLNVRVGPGTNYDTSMQIRQSGIYTVIAEATGQGGDGVWYMIVAGENGAQSGWISRQHTKPA